MPASYPLDTTGLSPGNFIPNESHVLTEINSSTERIIIPAFAPFYLDNFSLVHIDSTGEVVNLIPDVDYYHCLPYLGASRSIGKMIYGGIAINTNLIQGELRVSYQTLGGDWVADSNFVRERLFEMAYNPKTTIWDIVTNKPNQFPPTNHNQPADTIFGMQELIRSLDDMVNTIASGAGSNSGNIAIHLTDIDNPHQVTKKQVGLEFVENYGTANEIEVSSKISVDKYVLLSQVLTLLSGVAFSKADIGLGNVDNTSDANKPVSTAVASALSGKSNIGHLHSPADVGLGNVQNYDTASSNDVTSRSLVDKYILLSQVIPLIQQLSLAIAQQAAADAVAGITVNPTVKLKSMTAASYYISRV